MDREGRRESGGGARMTFFPLGMEKGQVEKEREVRAPTSSHIYIPC